MTQIIEGSYDANGNPSSEQLEQAIDTILRDYRVNVTLPIEARIHEGREGKMELLDSLFTPDSEEEKALEAQMIQEARGRGYVKHEGADGYEYTQTPAGKVMVSPDRSVIVEVN